MRKVKTDPKGHWGLDHTRVAASGPRWDLETLRYTSWLNPADAGRQNGFENLDRGRKVSEILGPAVYLSGTRMLLKHAMLARESALT